MIPRDRFRQKALSLQTAEVVYICQTGRGNSDYEVIDARTGEVTTLTPKRFQARYVPSWQLPPHLRRKADAAPSWWDWQARMVRG